MCNMRDRERKTIKKRAGKKGRTEKEQKKGNEKKRKEQSKWKNI